MVPIEKDNFPTYLTVQISPAGVVIISKRVRHVAGCWGDI